MRSLVHMACLLLLLPLAAVNAEPKRKSVQSLVAAADALKKNDPKLKNAKVWESLSAELKAAAERKPRNDQSEDALYAYARLEQFRFRTAKARTALTRAVDAFERMAVEHAGGDLTDDALLALGDLRRDGLKDEVAARAAYYEIIDRYPGSNAFETARSRLGLSARVGLTPTKVTVAKPTAEPTRAPTARPTPLAEVEDREPVVAPTAAAILPPESRKVFAKESTVRRPLIVIDPGHGGEDLGALGADGVLEKDVVLNVSEFLDEFLRERLRARTFLTRSRDVFIPLPDRTKLANDKDADLFISIHANASEYKTASGIETYYLDNTNDKSSLKLAKRENMSLDFGGGSKNGIDVSFMLSDLIQNAKLDDSISLAHTLQNALHANLSLYYRDVNNLGVKKAPFHVLVGAHMPCVLVEISFIDHPVEGRRLAEKRYQRMVALAIYQGVREFFVSRTER